MRIALVTLLVGFFAFLAGGRALAVTEFCPARVAGWTPATGAATTYTYELTAFTPRSVDAMVVADTDQGWFGWHLKGIQLQRASYVDKHDEVVQVQSLVRSPRLTVQFPFPAVVSHVFVTSAQTTGEPVLGWDKLGNVPCTPDLGIYGADLSRDDTEPAPLPSGAPPTPPPPTPPPPIQVEPVDAPFEMAACPQPFEPSAIDEQASPNALRPLGSSGLLGQLVDQASADVFVVLDGNGKVLDQWLFSSSGYPRLDANAMAAARTSTYNGAIAYCKPVKSLFIFRIKFNNQS
jgi:hypothetical protein